MEFREFSELFGKGGHKRRIFENYVVPIVNSFGRDLSGADPGHFSVWLSKTIRFPKNTVVLGKILPLLSADAEFVSLVNSSCCISSNIRTLLGEFNAVFPRAMTPGDFSKCMSELVRLAPPDGICSDLSLDAAIGFCRNPQNLRRFSMAKLNLLDFRGFPLCGEIEACGARRLALSNLHDRIFHDRAVRFSTFVEVDVHIGGLIGGSMDVSPSVESDVFRNSILSLLAEKIESFARPSTAYLCVSRVLAENNPELSVELEKRSSRRMKNVRVVDYFREISPWNTRLLDSVMARYTRSVEKNSAYPRECMETLEYRSVVIFNFLEKFSSQNYDGRSLEWFLSNATIEMARSAILCYGSQIRIVPERNKNNHSVHHAKAGISNILSVFKKGLVGILSCHVEILGSTMSEFLSEIENRRLNDGVVVRRCYLESEIQSMLSVVENDSMWTLVLTILSEVGLRSGAICEMRVCDLLDEFWKPRHVCRVLEKGNKFREFITSANLKSKIKIYAAERMCPKKTTVGTEAMFLYGKENKQKITRASLGMKLKRVGYMAGITDVAVHPHSFRHTIVGKLMSYGNSSDLVSKFMGHESVDTTIKYYWVRTADEISTEIRRNPFSQIRVENDDEIETVSVLKIRSAIAVIQMLSESKGCREEDRIVAMECIDLLKI